jgi:hypothetical protein
MNRRRCHKDGVFLSPTREIAFSYDEGLTFTKIIPRMGMESELSEDSGLESEKASEPESEKASEPELELVQRGRTLRRTYP